MIITTSSSIAGKEIVETFGLVMGNTIRAKWIGTDIEANIRSFIGGELTQYTELLFESREQAITRMIREAKHLRANAIVDVRFTTSEVMLSCAEILVYGTAVKIKTVRKKK